MVGDHILETAGRPNGERNENSMLIGETAVTSE